MKLAVCTGTPDIINANVLRKYIHVARVRIVSSFQSPLVANGGYSECIMGWGQKTALERRQTLISTPCLSFTFHPWV